MRQQQQQLDQRWARALQREAQTDKLAAAPVWDASTFQPAAFHQTMHSMAMTDSGHSFMDYSQQPWQHYLDPQALEHTVSMGASQPPHADALTAARSSLRSTAPEWTPTKKTLNPRAATFVPVIPSSSSTTTPTTITTTATAEEEPQ
jgi:di/tripeptidase